MQKLTLLFLLMPLHSTVELFADRVGWKRHEGKFRTNYRDQNAKLGLHSSVLKSSEMIQPEVEEVKVLHSVKILCSNVWIQQCQVFMCVQEQQSLRIAMRGWV